jgi:hypothetical protein
MDKRGGSELRDRLGIRQVLLTKDGLDELLR